MAKKALALSIDRISTTLAHIWCEGGRVQDLTSGIIFNEVECGCKEWQSDEQVLNGFRPVAL